jgi:hypothetical protein
MAEIYRQIQPLTWPPLTPDSTLRPLSIMGRQNGPAGFVDLMEMHCDPPNQAAGWYLE